MRKLLFTILLILLVFNSSDLAYAAGEKSPIYFGMPEYNGIPNEVYGQVDSIFRLRSSGEMGHSNIANANNTGYGNVVKATQEQRIHGGYTSNTNSCASCHQTHTASGPNLLFRNGIWSVCTACHDGTLGKFNVLEDPSILKNKINSGGEHKLYSLGGGTFAGPAGMGTSVHMATGMLKVNLAPGGNDLIEDPLSNDPESWGSVFSCSSCHSPHGSYSSRLLHYNPNNVGARTWDDRGYKRVGVAVYSEDTNNERRYYITKDNTYSTYANRDKTPWLDNFEYVDAESGITKDYWTSVLVNGEPDFVDSDGKLRIWMNELKFNSAEAYFTDPNNLLLEYSGSSITMNVSPATVVTFEFENEEISNYGKSMPLSRFCASCHNDYLNITTETMFERFNDFFGHRVDVKIPDGVDVVGGTGIIGGSEARMLNCLTCHYAHGTTKDIMLNAENVVNDSDVLAVEDTTSLKRYINASVCLKCHDTVIQNQ